MRPPRSRTWGRRGITPVIRVRGGGTGRVSVAGLACYRPGDRSRLIYRLHCYRGRKGETKAFTWTEYRDLLIAAHRQLPGGNVVLVWDNLNVHLGAELRAFTGAQAWLRVFRLPAYAPDLNPVEGIWSVLKGGVLANLAVASFAHLVQVIRHGLKKIQYQPGLIEGCLAGTGLTLDQAEQPNGHHELKTEFGARSMGALSCAETPTVILRTSRGAFLHQTSRGPSRRRGRRRPRPKR